MKSLMSFLENQKLSVVILLKHFLILARIPDDKVRTYNIVGFARNLIRDYEKDGRFANLPIFLENLVDIVREE